jgi:hypothetical protein
MKYYKVIARISDNYFDSGAAFSLNLKNYLQAIKVNYFLPSKVKPLMSGLGESQKKFPESLDYKTT